MSRFVVWFSCGAASAVAAKLAVEKYCDKCSVVYCDTMASEHPDNKRFFCDVQEWIKRPITIIRSNKYASIDEVFERSRYMAGINGAKCTVEMKKHPREAWQSPSDTHIFGYTAEEQDRADRFDDQHGELATEWILIDQFVRKSDCLRMLEAAKIALPSMYSLGFDHNNCLGCVKSTSAGYWNRIRRLFPEVFNRRVQQSRSIGCRLVRVNGERVYLDELPADLDGPDDDIECGVVCQMPLFRASHDAGAKEGANG